MNESRKQFEAWYQKAGISNWAIRFNREPDGRYSFVGTENHWLAWNAGRDVLKQEVAELTACSKPGIKKQRSRK